MAKKSNKTAHVLNLLAGHDAVKETEGTAASAESGISDEEAELSSAAVPADAEDFSDETQEPAILPTSPAPQPNQAPPKAAQTASQNTISLIDKTEDDPVADLIHEKLSSEFDKQIHESLAEASPIGQEADSYNDNFANMDTVDDDDNLSPAESGTPLSEFDSVEMENPDTEGSLNPVENKDAVPGTSPDAAAILNDTEDEETGSEDNSDLQDALEQNTIESAQALSEKEEEMEAMAEMDVDLKAEPEAAEPTVPEPEPEPEPEFSAVNVMERIVNDKIIYYMRQFDVCTCDRCKADVIALTLNGLLPKYIVTMPAAVDPLISYYTNRLISDVTVEATKACMIVKENPRH